LYMRMPSVGDNHQLFNFWYGKEKDPMLFNVDLKMFFYQPSLLGLMLINVAFAEYQYRAFNGQVSIQMIVYLLFWYFYLFTHYIREDFMLWTFDILEDHFGYMLVFGDLVYVPFWYSVCGWFLADQMPSKLTGFWILITCSIYLFGHYIFRESNWQKFDFKRYGMKTSIWFEKPKLLENKLLISGFWGLGRHLNYTGEILVYLSIALLTGRQSYIPYLLPFSLFVLLGQRAWRDDRRCRQKYGDNLWQRYCNIAKFRMIPFVY